MSTSSQQHDQQAALLPFHSPLKTTDATSIGIAADHSLLDIDSELAAIFDRMENELEEEGHVSAESELRFEQFCEAFGEKVDRIGRFLRVMETRAAFCRAESARLASRAKTTENRVGHLKSLLLYFMGSRNLGKLEGREFTLRRQKNSQDSLVIQSPQVLPMRLKRIDVTLNGLFWETLLSTIDEELRTEALHGLRAETPDAEAVKQALREGEAFEGVSVSRGCHLRVV
jgi:hypothetical protein